MGGTTLRILQPKPQQYHLIEPGCPARACLKMACIRVRTAWFNRHLRGLWWFFTKDAAWWFAWAVIKTGKAPWQTKRIAP